LPAAWDGEYSELHALPALEAELPRSLWIAKKAASHTPVVLADLTERRAGTEDATAAAVLYRRATSIKVEHFGVPEIIDAQDPATGDPYLAWSIESGESLRASLTQAKFPSIRRALEIIRSLAETLAELHRHGHLVGTLSPASICLGPAGITQLVGLGLGHYDATKLYGAGLRYRAPEQLRSEPWSMSERLLAADLHERADLWALGMIVLELIDRRPRLQCQAPHDLLAEIQEANFAPASDAVSWELEELLVRLLEIDVVQRTITAEEVSEQIDGLLMATSSRSLARTVPPNPPLPIPPPGTLNRSENAHSSRSRRTADWNWRSATRTLQQRRQAFDRDPREPPLWKVWLLPALALGLLGLAIFGLIQMVRP